MTITVVATVSDLWRVLQKHRAEGRAVGFVPTMGFLHDGHASLMRAAAEGNDIVVASIFVNPLQFAANEDLSTYPKDVEADTALAEANGVDVLFVPHVDEMYPDGPVLTSVYVSELSDRLEAGTRPTHFSGVATVVTKLFSIVGPCRAYFGEKDFQQLAIIRRMVRDLSMPVEVIGCPIIREPDGLAMSSRNVYLTADQRPKALVLRRALDAGVAEIESGQRVVQPVLDAMAEIINHEPEAVLDYVAVVDAASLEAPDVIAGELRLLVAATVGIPRLIDNQGIFVS